MKRTVLFGILAVVAVAVVVGLVFWRSTTMAEPAEEARSAVVERGSMLVTILASGSVEPEARVGLVFGEVGRVAEVLVETGDAVEAGDVLARLETEQQELRVRQAQAALASTEARLAQLRSGPRPEEVAAAEANRRAAGAQVSISEANVDQVRTGASDAQVAAAEAEHVSAMAQQRAAEDAHEMTMTCKKFSLPTGEKMVFCPALGTFEEQARFNLAVADKALAAAQIRLDELRAGADADAVREAQANRSAVVAQRDASQAQLDLLLAGATDGQIAAAEAQVAQAQASLELAELSLESAVLRAPFGGIVAGVNAVVGQVSSAGQSDIVLVDTSRFRSTIGVDELDVGRLAEGQAARVMLDALPGEEVTGIVERIAPAAMFEGGVVTYDVVIGLISPEAPIRTGMTANVTIVVEELTDVLMIPTWVVRVDRTTGQTYVHRQVEGDVEQVDVELGVRHEGVAQVLGGLSEGDVVIWVEESAGFGFGQP